MSESSIKVGVAGVGYLGQHHARIYSLLEDVELVGVYDINTKRAEKIAREYNCKVFESIEELGDACDAASVVVPTDKHYEISLPLMERGVHLLIEKPLCTSMEEASAIMAAAKKHNVTVQVGHIEHYNPVMSFLDEAVTEAGFINADRLAIFNPRGTEVGVVLDLMIHDLGVILQLIKAPIERIDAVGVKVLSKTEDIANTRINFANGAVANINTSRVSLKKKREIRIIQPDSYLSLDFMKQKGHYLEKGGILGMKKKRVPIQKGEPLMIELKSFVQCVKEQKNPKVDASLGVSALELALEITDQIRNCKAYKRS